MNLKDEGLPGGNYDHDGRDAVVGDNRKSHFTVAHTLRMGATHFCLRLISLLN